LGAVELKKGWYFKRSYRLLIFDNGILDNRARKLIDRLLNMVIQRVNTLLSRWIWKLEESWLTVI